MEYVTAYPENLRALVALNLTARQFRVMFYILDVMEWGNLLGFSQKTAGEALGIDKTSMSKIFKSLIAAGVLVKTGGHTFLNSNLFAKGLSKETYSNTAKRLADAAVATQHIHAARTPAAASNPAPHTAQTPAPVPVSVEKPRQAAARPANGLPAWQVAAVAQARAQRAKVPL